MLNDMSNRTKLILGIVAVLVLAGAVAGVVQRPPKA